MLVGETDVFAVVTDFHHVLSGGGYRYDFLFLVELDAHLLVQTAEDDRMGRVVVHEAH